MKVELHLGDCLEVMRSMPDQRVLVEINGGTYARMGHSTGTGIARDYEKSNLAVLAGWKVFAFDRRMVEGGTALDVTAKALGIG